MAARTAKHGKCIRHDKLPCGCKVCVTPNSTAYNDPLSLIAFHAMIHRSQAQHAARPRLPGDGRIEGPNGERLTPSEVVRRYDELTEAAILAPEPGRVRTYDYALGLFINAPGQGARASQCPSRFVTAEERAA